MFVVALGVRERVQIKLGEEWEEWLGGRGGGGGGVY